MVRASKHGRIGARRAQRWPGWTPWEESGPGWTPWEDRGTAGCQGGWCAPAGWAPRPLHLRRLRRLLRRRMRMEVQGAPPTEDAGDVLRIPLESRSKIPKTKTELFFRDFADNIVSCRLVDFFFFCLTSAGVLSQSMPLPVTRDHGHVDPRGGAAEAHAADGKAHAAAEIKAHAAADHGRPGPHDFILRDRLSRLFSSVGRWTPACLLESCPRA